MLQLNHEPYRKRRLTIPPFKDVMLLQTARRIVPSNSEKKEECVCKEKVKERENICVKKKSEKGKTSVKKMPEKGKAPVKKNSKIVKTSVKKISVKGEMAVKKNSVKGEMAVKKNSEKGKISVKKNLGRWKTSIKKSSKKGEMCVKPIFEKLMSEMEYSEKEEMSIQEIVEKFFAEKKKSKKREMSAKKSSRKGKTSVKKTSGKGKMSVKKASQKGKTSVEKVPLKEACLYVEKNTTHSEEGETSVGTESKERKNSSIIGKVRHVYLKYAEKNKHAIGPFIKHNYLDILVQRLNLNYITIALHPSKISLRIINPNKTNEEFVYEICKDKDHHIIESIERGEIPSYLLAIFKEHNLKIMYDLHIITRIQKFLTRDELGQPCFTIFSLLKVRPHVNIMDLHYQKEEYDPKEGTSKDHVDAEGETPLDVWEERRLKKITEILKYVNPVCFGATIKYLKRRYHKDCAYALLISLVRNLKIELEPTHKNIDENESLKRNGVNLEMLESCQTSVNYFVKNCEENETEIYMHNDFRNRLSTLLDSRDIDFAFENNVEYDEDIFIETFSFEYVVAKTAEHEIINVNFDVYMRNNLFYIVSERDSTVFAFCNRMRLDRYILDFASVSSKSFRRFMSIKRKVLGTEVIFFLCGSDCGYHYELEKEENLEIINKMMQDIKDKSETVGGLSSEELMEIENKVPGPSMTSIYPANMFSNIKRPDELSTSAYQKPKVDKFLAVHDSVAIGIEDISDEEDLEGCSEKRMEDVSTEGSGIPIVDISEERYGVPGKDSSGVSIQNISEEGSRVPIEDIAEDLEGCSGDSVEDISVDGVEGCSKEDVEKYFSFW